MKENEDHLTSGIFHLVFNLRIVLSKWLNNKTITGFGFRRT